MEKEEWEEIKWNNQNKYKRTKCYNMNRKIKIMVGSTVYGFENELYQIVALLQTLGYEVLNSHVGTIKVNPKLSNLENCLNAVDVCDLFLGIIRPYYGTGNLCTRLYDRSRLHILHSAVYDPFQCRDRRHELFRDGRHDV